MKLVKAEMTRGCVFSCLVQRSVFPALHPNSWARFPWEGLRPVISFGCAYKNAHCHSLGNFGFGLHIFPIDKLAKSNSKYLSYHCI